MIPLKSVVATAALIAGATLLTMAQSGSVSARSHNGAMSYRHVTGMCGSDTTSCCCYTQHGAAFCAQEGSCFNRGGTCAATGC
jgi:hypothetical protein